jgi:hypothetical protein
MSNISEEEVYELIRVASLMREALEECRNQPLPLALARHIDHVLAEAQKLD